VNRALINCIIIVWEKWSDVNYTHCSQSEVIRADSISCGCISLHPVPTLHYPVAYKIHSLLPALCKKLVCDTGSKCASLTRFLQPFHLNGREKKLSAIDLRWETVYKNFYYNVKFYSTFIFIRCLYWWILGVPCHRICTNHQILNEKITTQPKMTI